MLHLKRAALEALSQRYLIQTFFSFFYLQQFEIRLIVVLHCYVICNITLKAKFPNGHHQVTAVSLDGGRLLTFLGGWEGGGGSGEWAFYQEGSAKVEMFSTVKSGSALSI